MPVTVSIRPLAISDAEEMAVVLAHPDLYAFTGGVPPTASDLRQRYRLQERGRSPDGGELWINHVVVAGSEHRAVGFVQATVPVGGGPTEIAWVIGRSWQGRGYATQAMSLLIDQLRIQGTRHVAAYIHPDHEASQRVARRLGLQPTDITDDGETCWAGEVS